MKWLSVPHVSKSPSYLSIIFAQELYLILLHKKDSTYEQIAAACIPLEHAGIVDGRLCNPSFFAWELYRFLSEHQIKNLELALILDQEHPAIALQFTLWGTYFQFPFTRIRNQKITLPALKALPDEQTIKQYLPAAIAAWHGGPDAKH